MARQVGVVRGGDVVEAEWVVHVSAAASQQRLNRCLEILEKKLFLDDSIFPENPCRLTLRFATCAT